jgi:hypothetical protein
MAVAFEQSPGDLAERMLAAVEAWPDCRGEIRREQTTAAVPSGIAATSRSRESRACMNFSATEKRGGYFLKMRLLSLAARCSQVWRLVNQVYDTDSKRHH